MRAKDPIETPSTAVRDATQLEISRIKGELVRLEIGYVRTPHPELIGPYVEQARRTLRITCDKGERDPRLLAEMGLGECGADNDAVARPYLQAAVNAQVVKLMAYFQLARMQFAELISVHAGAKPTAEQIAEPLELFSTALRQSPRFPRFMNSFSESGCWTRCR